MPNRDDALVSTAWLAAHLRDPDLRVVDGTYFLPNVPRDADAEFLDRHIAGAVRFDIDAIKDEKNPLPHMLPAPEVFAAKVGALGLGDGTRIVAYNADGPMAAARVWWMFRVFGHDRVAVLDGGLPKWLAEARPVEKGPAAASPAVFTPRFRKALVRGLDEVRAELRSGRASVADARSAGRYSGAEPEIRPGLESGHMPGAKNLPYGSLLDADGTFLSPADIARHFAAAGIDASRPVTTTCGSGVTACILALGLYLAGKEDAAVYDGSWTEWGGRADTPVATG
ncbi:MAG TPA: rhodanese-like domain-containing protein [Stellaceae bacterium]|nr:rhodanese-like domain-containing protein [Stellaceae bacterium]